MSAGRRFARFLSLLFLAALCAGCAPCFIFGGKGCGEIETPVEPPKPRCVVADAPGRVCTEADEDKCASCFICDARSNFEWAPQPGCEEEK